VRAVAEEGVAMEKGAGTRRRRLVERGSDRLAFITGQTRSLSCDPIPDSPLRSQFEGGTRDDGFSERNQLQKSEPSDLVPGFQDPGTRQGVKARTLSYDALVPEFERAGGRQENNASTLSYEDELFRKFKMGSAVPEIQPVNQTPLHTHDQETVSNNIIHAGVSKNTSHDGVSKNTSHDEVASVQPSREAEMRPRSAPPSQSTQADNSGWSVETLMELLDFTPQEITKAISATESNRFVASVVIAFLVVLSNWGLDIGGAITRVLVGTRPLLFLIITNITIVFTLLMDNKDPNVKSRPVGANLGSADSLGQMLEIGFLLQKALGALLIDCSVCAVIMIRFLGF